MDKFSRYLRSAGLLTCTLFNAAIGIVTLWIWSVQPPRQILVASQVVSKSAEVEYKDFVSILLTAIAVMIALGSIVAALLAVVTYAEGLKLIERIVERRIDTLAPTLARAKYGPAASTTEKDSTEIIGSLDEDDGSEAGTEKSIS